MKIGGGSPYRNIGQTSRTQKTKGTKKAGFASKAEAASEVATPDAVEPVEEEDSPLYDAMSSAAQDYEGDLEEATQTVVAAVIHQRFGGQNLPQSEVEQLTAAVTESLTSDSDMRNRLDSVLRRIQNRRK
ncbi:MAG: hypothetical protein EP343_32450 [Deltaproteobacteria bacterium]|nr:MAG: hypothetical protein EP343_32450 [Deltaproteobacteria bacterium]